MSWILRIAIIVIGGVFVGCAPYIVRLISGVRSALHLKPTMFSRCFDVEFFRCAGFVLIMIGTVLSLHDPNSWRALMLKDENRIALLENGIVGEGRVVKARYKMGAPKGWTLYYELDVNDPVTNSLTTYIGRAEGPKRYYAYLKPGDEATVIYCPSNPKINCEIKYFLNSPNYRRTFKKAQKLHLLDKFRDEYPLEDVDRDKWYEEREKK